MRALLSLLTAIAVVTVLVAPVAQAVPAPCSPPRCPDYTIQTNHICYVPNACLVPIDIVDANHNPPIPTEMPVTGTLRYNVLPVRGTAHTFIPVEGRQLTIQKGATTAEVPIQLTSASGPYPEQARVEIYGPSVGMVLNGVSTVVITRVR